MSGVVRARGISKRFGDNRVLENIGLELVPGAPLCVMGRSGCGKTTLANIMLGLLEPDSGELTGVRGSKKAALFQSDRLIPSLSAVANVRFVCGKAISTEQIERALLAVGLPEASLALPCEQLSGGMRRRTAIVRALLPPFDLLVLDEPFKGLDDATRELVLAFVRPRLLDKAVLIVSHDPRDADELGASVLRL